MSQKEGIITFDPLKKSKQRILIAPLDWGLGHATRCVPLIRELKADFEPVLAASGRSKQFLQQLFPDLLHIDFEGYNIRYPANGNMATKMLLQVPKVIQRIKEEHRELQSLIREHRIDLVISDNRFGLYSSSIPCIYITHQIHIQAPNLLSDPLFKLHGKYIKRYTECWIPDHPDKHNLSGELGHGEVPANCRYIGPLSRLQKVDCEKAFDYCALISGPEPQRTKFEDLLLSMFRNRAESLLLLCGKPEENSKVKAGNITRISHQGDQELARSICSAKAVIVRPGYSSIMDLAQLEAPCILVPTPGQTEQQYLAEYHQQTNSVPWFSQSELSMEQLKQTTASIIQTNWESPNFNQEIRRILDGTANKNG